MQGIGKRMLRVWMIGMVLLVASACQAEEKEAKTLSPYFFVEQGDPATDRLPLKETDVRVQINGVIADVIIKQRYTNEGKKPINARYVFPASTRAAVQGMKMTIGNQVIVAKIKEKETAQQEFNAAKKKGQSASLLSQHRPNVFTMNVANIMPRDTVAIELHYTELLVPTEGTYEFMYPTVVGPRYSTQEKEGATIDDQWLENPYLKKGTTPKTKFNITTHLSTGMKIQEVACRSHETTTVFDNPAAARVTLKNPENFSGNRDYILQYRLADRKIQTGLMLYSGGGGGENYFLLSVQPPQRVGNNDIPPREYIFVVDVSGSMHGFPLDITKELLKNLIGALRPSDLFNVVLFSGGSQVMNPASLPATRENIAIALSVIDEQQGGGGTELLSAMKTTLALPRNRSFSRSVIIATDGFIGAEKEVFNMIHDNLADTNIFAFGIGTSVNRYLIEGIAHAGLGEPFIVTRPEDAPAIAKRFCNYIKSPVMKDIRLTFQGFDAYDLEPDVIPDLFAERPIVVIGKWRGKPEGRIRITGNSGQGPFVQEFNVAGSKPLTEHQALMYLWARTKIARLSDFASGDEEAKKQEITALGLKYHLLTKYTSFIAVHEVVRNQQGAADDVKQPLPLPQGVSNLAIGQSVTKVPEPELYLLLILPAVLLVNTFRKHLKVART